MPKGSFLSKSSKGKQQDDVTSASRPPSPGLLGMQASAGNAATHAALAAQAARSRIAALRSDLAADLGDSRTALVGGSSYAVLHKALLAYEQTMTGGSLEVQAAALHKLDRLATDWLNSHRKPQDADRRKVVGRLEDEIASQRMALSRKQSLDVYTDSMTAGVTINAQPALVPRDYAGKMELAGSQGRTATAHARDGWTQAMTTAEAFGNERAKARVLEKRKLVDEHGLDPAEIGAIATYTDADYQYINPAAANVDDWMKAQKTGTGASREMRGAEMKTLKEEGSLQTAVAMQGLAKLPDYKGTSFRGERTSDADLLAKGIKRGKVLSYPNLTSTSKSVDTARAFAGTWSDDKRDVAVIWEFRGCGKDVELMSVNDGEREVLVSPGEKLVVLDVTEIDLAGPVPAGTAEAAAHTAGQQTRKALVITVVPVPKTPAPPTPG